MREARQTITETEAEPMSLSDVLAALGFTHAPGTRGNGHRQILRDGIEVFSGDYQAVWQWLRDTGRLVQDVSAAA